MSNDRKDEQFRVVGIGASAGGLESLEQLFASLPDDPGMAFVVIQHLSPDFRSMMDELLARHSRMPIHMAEHGVEVEPNHVYLLPPRKEMIIRDGRLLLTDKDPGQSLALPIDQFFRSLANDCGPAAVGVILSGSGTDGSRGVREIRNAGGTVIVETPGTARFDGMPVSAIASGVAAHVLPAAAIAEALLQLRTVPLPSREELADSDTSPMGTILHLLRDQFGLDFSVYKTSTVSRRVYRRVEMGDVASLEAYAERLKSDPGELGRLYHDLLIGVTRFFRDPAAYAVLEREVLPDIIARTPADDEVRVWVAGCATGEEAYSVGMLFVEQLTAAGRPLNLKILATDMHRASLAQASTGAYDEEQLEHVSRERRERFFSHRDGRFTVSSDLRQHIVFAPHNVLKDAPFTKMHLITCRNLLIYLEPHAQKMVLSLFHFGLTTGGALFLGSSETPGDLLAEFTAVDDHWKIYRKRRDVRLFAPDRLSTPRRVATSLGYTAVPAPRPTLDAQLLGVYDQLLDRSMPPSFLIDEDRRLIDSFGGAERLTHVGRRRPSMNLLDLLDGDLRTIVGGAIQRVLSGKPRVRYEGVPVPDGDVSHRATLSAELITNSRTQSRYILITLRPDPAQTAIAADAAPPTLPAAELTRERVESLEADLSYTRETLQATIEELQTSNEEVQATNEELIASNEELQSTNEELHSVNEELYTVNAEHQRKILELRELNSDMQHLLDGTDVGMLFLDGDLRIRRYTPRIAPAFHLEPGDLGRSIRHFSHGLLRPTLMEEIDQVLRTRVVIEDEVTAVDGTPFFLRILPYQPIRPADDAEPEGATGDGVVVSLTDISTLIRAQESVRRLSMIVESCEDAIIGHTLDGTITTWNAGAARLYGYAPAEAIGRPLGMLVPDDEQDQWHDALRAVARGDSLEHFECPRVRKDGVRLDVSVTMSPTRDRTGAVVSGAAIARDVAPLRQAHRELESREARIRLLLDSTAEAIYGIDTDGRCTFCNRACARALGYASVDAIIGQPVEKVLACQSGEAGDRPEHPARRVLRTGEGTHAVDAFMVRADGSTFPVEYWSYPVRRETDVLGAVVTFIDITDRKKAEAEIRDGARRRDQFLAMLSHELRNPLAAVVNATHVLQRAPASRDAVGRASRVITRQTAHMARLLDDLLDVARITKGGIDLRKSELDFRAVIQPAIEASGPMLQERMIRLTVDVSPDPLPVVGDGARLQQVVGNLVANAARYSDGGASVHVSAYADGDDVVLAVRDTGRGIEPEMLDLIFDLFVQGEQGLDRRGGGLGVGLTLVRQIVQLHGGTVTAQSDGRGSGSEFTVRLPRQRRFGGALLPDSADEPAGPPRRVVLAEDQPDAREMMRLLLEQLGHTVIEAADGPSALSMIESSRPDVALIDIGLPLMSGYDVAKRLRANPGLEHVLLVALTGYGTQDDVQRARAAGFDEHVTKPSDFDRLSELIRRGRSSVTS